METHIAVFSESNMTNRLSKKEEEKKQKHEHKTKTINQRVNAPCVQQTPPRQRMTTHHTTSKQQQQQQQQHTHACFLTLVGRVFHGRQA